MSTELIATLFSTSFLVLDIRRVVIFQEEREARSTPATAGRRYRPAPAESCQQNMHAKCVWSRPRQSTMWSLDPCSGRNGAQAHVVAVARAKCPSHSWTGRLASCYSLGLLGDFYRRRSIQLDRKVEVVALRRCCAAVPKSKPVDVEWEVQRDVMLGGKPEIQP